MIYPKAQQFENKNQIVIKYVDEEGNQVEVFQSYDSTIAVEKGDSILVDPDYCFYSNTTSKHFKLRVGSNNFDVIKKHLKKGNTSDLKNGWSTFVFTSLN